MKLIIQNKTKSNVTIDSVVGSVKGNSSKSFNLTINELERVRTRLTELDNAGVIDWSTDNDVNEDDRAEGATVAMLSTIALPTPPASAQHWYVSGVNGSDQNDGLTAGSPLATLTRLEQLLPNEITSTNIVHIGPASIVTDYKYAAPSIRARKLSRSIIFIGDGGGQSGTAGLAFNLLYSDTVQAGSTTTSIRLAGTGQYADGTLIGKTVFIPSGTGSSQPKTILSNVRTFGPDITTIVPAFPLSAVTTGTPVQVFEPNVIVDIPDTAGAGEHVLVRGCGSPSTDASIIVGSSPSVYFLNMRFTGTPTGTYATAIQGSRVVFAGVEYVGETTMQIRVDNSTLICGLDIVDTTSTIDMKYEGVTLSLAANSTITGPGWGFSSLGAISTSTNHSFSGGKIDGFVVSTRGIIFREDATFYLRGGVLSMPIGNVRAPVTVRNGARGFIIAQTSSLPIAIEGPTSQGIDVGGISILDNGKLALSGCVISSPNVGTSGIWVARGGNLELGVNPALGAAGIGGYGLCCSWGGVATFGSPVGWTLTGTLGEMSIDNHSPFTAASLTSAGKMARGPGLIERLG